MSVRVFFAWYDLWQGWYFDRKGSVYWCPVPCLVVKISRRGVDR
jgi:hypothetical protein